MKMKHLSLLCFIIFTALVPCSCNPEPNNLKANSLEELAFLSIKKIVDGDTFWVEDGTEKGLKIRLIGVDAPESRKTFKKEVGFYGKEAKAYLTSLLKGKKVKLEYDVKRTDQYGRTLAYVYLPDGTFINADLVKNGYATIMTVPPNVKFAEEFLKLQQEARENERGLWGVILE
jgi:micrococcal nuclease